MTRTGLFRVFLAAALATLHAPLSAAAVCPPLAPVMPAHPDERHVVLLVTATPDTVLAGWGDVSPGPGERPPGWREQPVYGQVAHAARVAGPGADSLAPGRVVLVPWTDACRPHPVRWGWRSFVWMRPGVPDVVVGRLRRPEDRVGGVATIDVLRTDLVRESRQLPGAARWTATPDEFFGLYATLPTRQQIDADPWGAVAPMRAWLAANPASALHRELRFVTNGIYRQAAYADARSAPSPLAGTWRIEVSHTGGPVHLVYGRTEFVPAGALFPADTTAAVFPAELPGYRLRMFFAHSLSRLPSPRPGALARWWRRVQGVPFGDELEVWLPAVQAADGSRRVRGHLGLWSSTHLLFPDDPMLRTLIHEWSRRETSNMRVQNPVGEGVLRADGGVEWLEVLQVTPDRAVTIRATRISARALETPVER